MDHTVSITLPSTENVRNKADIEKLNAVYSLVIGELCVVCGGATKVNGYGYWVNDDNTLVDESIAIVIAYCADEQFEAACKTIVTLARYVRITLSQQSVLYRIDNSTYFV